MNRIYTRTGDQGLSSVGNGRLSKSAPVFGVLGALDELDAHLGLLPESEFLSRIRRALVSLMADLSGCGTFAPVSVSELEAEIDRLLPHDEPFELRPLRGEANVARTVCRRAERELVAYAPDHAALPFVNRLSDWLYALARRGV